MRASGGDELTLEWVEYRAPVGGLTCAWPSRAKSSSCCPATTTSWPSSTSSGSSARSTSGLLEGESIGPGDWVLIHVGFAMSKVDEQEAAEALRMLELMGQAFTDELQAVAESRIE